MTKALVTMKDQLQKIAAEHEKVFSKSFKDSQLDILEQIARELLKAFKSGNKILLCGNGGSAADSQHIAAEFIARFKLDRKSLPAIALTTDSSIVTAVSNDYDFDIIFSRQIEGLGHKGDVLIAISTSGNSTNVLEAARQAKEQGLFTVGLTGRDGGELKNTVDLCYHSQTDNTPHIQEMHITALHAISEVVEDVLFGS